MNMNLSETKIGILGAGAIGQLIGFQLHQEGAHLSFIHKYDYSCDEVVNFTDLDRNEHQYQIRALTASDPLVKQLKLIIVCVKAYHVMDAIKGIEPFLAKDCHIVLLHNGLGPHLEISQYLKANQGLSLGTTSQGATRDFKWSVTRTGKGLTQLGHCIGQPLNADLKQLLLAAIPNSEWTDEILPSLWYKLAVNSVINPLTAINSCKNGSLAHQDYSNTIQDIISELMLVAEHEKLPIERTLVHDRVHEVIKLTQNNYSSMHQDIAHQRQTEIDYINGYLVKLAHKHQIHIPTNKKLLDSIRLLSQQRQ
ncbi:2-dehydropantoate 2-reductase [Shewanella sp. OPT22]|nr:2-dehydropantoate 2-reductase [Shewanella sp. OPT22]